ncbi:hypothetical protein, partial [Escherichia coli]
PSAKGDDKFITTDYLQQCPSLHQYRIAPDTRHPDINLIKAHLDEGFQQAKSEGLKVEISDYKERLYLYIRTPGNNLMQYSGCREK